MSTNTIGKVGAPLAALAVGEFGKSYLSQTYSNCWNILFCTRPGSTVSETISKLNKNAEVTYIHIPVLPYRNAVRSIYSMFSSETPYVLAALRPFVILPPSLIGGHICGVGHDSSLEPFAFVAFAFCRCVHTAAVLLCIAKSTLVTTAIGPGEDPVTVNVALRKIALVPYAFGRRQNSASVVVSINEIALVLDGAVSGNVNPETVSFALTNRASIDGTVFVSDRSFR